jgi:hypothetical protein
MMANFTWGLMHVRLAIRAETEAVEGARARIFVNAAVHFLKGKIRLNAAGNQCTGCLSASGLSYAESGI